MGNGASEAELLHALGALALEGARMERDRERLYECLRAGTVSPEEAIRQHRLLDEWVALIAGDVAYLSALLREARSTAIQRQ